MSEIAPGGGERYAAWEKRAWSTVRDAPPPDLFGTPLPGSELEWQSAWFAGAFGREFRSTQGRAVRVIQFGHWNRGAGPDFTDTAVEIDGELRRGGIELDREARDWERHGHGANPAFGGVILHVHGPGGGEAEFFTRNHEHRQVPQVELTAPCIRAGLAGPHGQAEARVGRCAPVLAGLGPAALTDFLRCAAQRRLARKARRIRDVADTHGLDQAVYQGLAETLGYRSNQLALRVLAQRVPLPEAQSLEPVRREALFFGLAGFLEAEPFHRADGETRGYLKDLWDEWWRWRSRWEGTRPVPWRLGATRPANHPQRRLAALALAAGAWKTWSALLPGLRAGPLPETWAAEVERLAAGMEHPYWTHHYTLTSKRSATRLALFGRERVADWLGNWLYPLAVERDPAQWRAYESLRGARETESLRRARIRLLGDRGDAATWSRFYWQQQGLLQVYEDFCLRDASGCAACPLPEQLSQWGASG